MPASGSSETYTPERKFGGEADIVTSSGTITSGNDLAKLTVIARVTATGNFVPWAPAATDGSEKAIAITAEAIDASAAAVEGPIYIGGVFDPSQLVWPGGATDLEKAAAFDGTNIALREQLYSA